MPQNRLAAFKNQRNQDALPAAEEGRGGYEMTGISTANGTDISMSSLYEEVLFAPLPNICRHSFAEDEFHKERYTTVRC